MLFLVIIVLIFTKKETANKQKSKKLLTCPLRGKLPTKKYDSKGNYTEEYQRIRLIKYLLAKGYVKERFILEYVIKIGHKGINSLRVDLAIKQVNGFLIVAEIKKNYTKKIKLSAIKHQLIPAMRILNSRYGIYYDGTTNSRLLVKNNDGSLIVKNLNYRS